MAMPLIKQILNRIVGIENSINELKNIEDISSKFNINSNFKSKELNIKKVGKVISVRFYGQLENAVNGYANLLETDFFTIAKVIYFPIFNVTTGNFIPGQCGFQNNKSYFYSRSNLPANTTIGFYVTFII